MPRGSRDFRFDRFWYAAFGLWLVLALVLGVRLPPSPVSASGEEPAPEAAAAPPARGDHSILLVTLDTVRPDHLGCYGHALARTPVVDGLALEGVRFTQATAEVPLTLPSHSCMMTGKIPPRHGVRSNGAAALSPEEETLAERFRASGYRTAAFVASLILHRRFGLDQGFELYDDEAHRPAGGAPTSVSERPANEVTDSALAWFDGVRPEEKFFAWVHYYDAHHPYEPPAPYNRLFAGAPYDGEIAFADTELGRLIAGLKARGLWRNTVVVLASDHGEGLGEHNEDAHGLLVYDATMRVALIIDHPEARGSDASPFHSRVLDLPVELVDVAPTVADLAGIEPTASLDGRDLVPLILGREKPRPRVLYGECLDGFADHGWARLRTLREGGWKYIIGAREEVYDLSSDPKELRNLASRETDRAERFRRELRAQLTRAASSRTPAAPLSLDRDALARLQSLGYLGGASASPPDSSENDPTADFGRPDPTVMISHFERLMRPAVDAIIAQDAPRAHDLILKFLAVDPGSKQGLAMLAAAEIALGHLPQARSLLEQAIALDPGWAQPIRALATVMSDLGEPERAIALMGRALELAPNDPEGMEMLAKFLRRKGDLDGAIAEYEKAVAMDPELISARIELANAYEAHGEFDKAAASFRGALKTDPAHGAALVGLANLYAQLAPVGWSVGLYERALPLTDPRTAGGLYANLANAWATLGDHARAASFYREALRRAPGDAQTHYALGCSLAYLGDRAGARAEWGRALALDPTLEPARTNLERLRN